MTEPNYNPIIKPEIGASSSASKLSVAPVGTGMFSTTMQVIMGVPFPTDVLTESGVACRKQYCAARRWLHSRRTGHRFSTKVCQASLLREALNSW